MVEAGIIQKRLEKVRRALSEHGVDALFLHNLEEKKPALTIRYLTGFTGTHGNCLLSQDEALFITDGRYELQSKEEVAAWDVRMSFPPPITDLIRDFLQERHIRKLGVLSSQISWELVRTLQKLLGSKTEVVALPNIVSKIRTVKDEEEVRCIQASIETMEKALSRVYALVRPGVTELSLNRALRDALPEGVEFAFPSIIASGERSAIPHGLASEKVIQKGDIVQFDVGCIVGGYNSDISRVAVVGKATIKQRRMHKAVKEAIGKALLLYKPGVPAIEAAKAADEVLLSRGFPQFTHGLGHGMGLDVHEGPTVSRRTQDVFEAGNVVTIEPGIYIEGYGGMRIEEDVLITKSGPELLSKLPNDLLEL